MMDKSCLGYRLRQGFPVLERSGSAEGGQPSARAWGVPICSLFRVGGWGLSRELESPANAKVGVVLSGW